MDALACLGRHRSAKICGRRALAAFEATGDRARQAATYLNLGRVADARDRVRSAMKLWRKARRLLEPDDARRLACLDASEAAGLQALGRFEDAAALYRSAAESFTAQGSAASALQPLLGEAEVHALRGDLGGALARIQELEKTAHVVGDDNAQFEARLLRARLELDLGHVERARRLADTTAPLCRAAGRRGDAARFSVIAALAVARGAEGDLDRAITSSDRALQSTGLGVARAVMRVELSRQGVAVAPSEMLRAATQLHRVGLAVQGDLARCAAARAVAEEGRTSTARRLAVSVLRSRHSSVWPRLEAHQLLAQLDPDAANARRHLWHAVHLAESIRGRLASDGDRAAFTTRAFEVYGELIDALLESGTAAARRRAFELVARMKSRTLLEALDRRKSTAWADRPEVVRRWDAMRGELAAMLATMEGRGGESTRYAVSSIERRIGQVSRQLEDLELEVSRSLPALQTALDATPRHGLRARLRSGETYLELLLSGTDLVIFELTHHGLRSVRLPGVRGTIENLVGDLRFQLSKAAYGRRHLEAGGRVLLGKTRSILAELGELLLGTVVRRRRWPDVLYFAPHGSLHHIPFSALEVGGQPLLTRSQVAVVPSSAILARLLQGPNPAPRTVAVAGSHQAGLEIQAEVEQVSQAVDPDEVVWQATTGDVLRLMQQYEVVHIASHGAFQPLLPAGSGLRLADGWLTALDLASIPLGVRLVTIGACASGEVTVAPGEEVLGFERALLAGGVQTAVLAPGFLDDVVAREAAGEFFRHVRKSGPGEALRRAALALRDEAPHPALWAALQLFGNPRPWEVTS